MFFQNTRWLKVYGHLTVPSLVCDFCVAHFHVRVLRSTDFKCIFILHIKNPEWKIEKKKKSEYHQKASYNWLMWKSWCIDKSNMQQSTMETDLNA